jgi:hypothetical protein
MCTVTSSETLSNERIRQAQATEAFCRTLNPGGQNSRSECFNDLERVMYKRRQDKPPVFVVPCSLIREEISLNHDSVYTTHPGWKRKLYILAVQNWWHRMHKYLRKYVSK